jgi:hypothetical protein
MRYTTCATKLRWTPSRRKPPSADRAYRIAQYASTSTFIPPPADIVEEFSGAEEGEEEAGDSDVEGEVENEEPAPGGPEPAPAAPEPPVEAPINPQ